MSKKSILSTLLISSALLGTISASATTSAIRPEKKLVSVEKSNAKIYKNSKLQESKKAKKGTVYKVDGYRNINSKKYYRVYQEDAKGKVVYKGYILDKDTKVLKGQKPAKKDRLVALTKDDQTAWKSLYFNKKIKTYDGTKHSSNFEVKYSYNIGGKKYFSLYRGEKWMGYMDGSAFKVLTPKTISEDKQDYKVVKDYDTYSDIYFTENGQLTKGENVKVKRIYTFGTGRQYGSVYNKDGKWLGYANMSALEAAGTSTPEEPEKPDTKPDNPGDKPTDKPDGDKPGQGGDNKPGGDQGGSGSGDTGNQPGDGGTDDSGSGSQPGGGDQGGSGSGDTGTGGGDQGGSGDTGTGGDQPSQPDQPGQPDNPGTGGGDTGTPEQPKPEAPKPTKEEIKALKDAVEKAKKVVAAKDKLDGVEPVEHALEKAEKILKDEDKATKAEVTTATKEIEAAIKGITLKPSINSESIKKLHAAIEQLKETQKLGAGNLVNNEQYDKVLKEAEKVLEDAVNGKANKEKIDAETKKVNDFINKLQLNTKALEAKIEDVKAKSDKVYMTKAQEDEFNKFIEEAKKAAKDTKLSNTDKLKEIDENLKKAENFIKGQPTKEDVQKLIDATKKEQDTEAKLKGYESKIFENWSTVTEKDTAADTMLEEIKKDTASKNDATVEYTAEDVQDAAKALMDAMTNLEVNHTNLEKYDTAAKEAIKELDPEHQETAQDLLTSFEVAAGNASVKDLTQMVNAAKKLNKEIHDDQVQEINDVIEKAKRIEGVNKSKEDGQSAPNAKFYESGSYEAMNNALDAAEKAEQKLKDEKVASRSKRAAEVGATQVQNGKDAAQKEKELKDKIDALKVKDWTVKEVNGQLQLVKYTGNYTQTIKIPGSLKDEQVIINTTDQPLFIESTKKESLAVEVKFEENTNRKVKAVDSLKGAFSNNTNIQSVDFTGLDASKVKDFSEAFKGATALTTVTGLNVGATVTDIHGMFANSGLTTIDFTGWDTSKVTDVSSLFDGANKLATVNGTLDLTAATNFDHMFGGTSKLTTLNFVGWQFSGVPQEKMNNMFISRESAKKEAEKTGLTTVTLPNVDEGHNAPEGIVKGLEKAGQQSQLTNTVTIKANAKGTGVETIGKVKTSGAWEPEEAYKKGETIVSDKDKETLDNAPKLARAIISSPKASDEAKKLAGIVDAGYKVSENSTGNEEKSISKIDINKAWTDFGGSGHGSYYDALGDLQNYARNTASVTKEKLQKDAEELVDDMEDLRVLPDYLDKAMKEAQKAEANAKAAHVEDSEVETTEDLIADAKVIVEGKNDARRKLDNWDYINKLTAKLKEAAKKLTTIVKK